MHSTRSRAFTLLEVLAVIAIIMILVGIAIPSFEMTEANARVTALSQELQRMRTGIDYYSFQHQEQLPGFDPGTSTWTATAFLNQLTQATDMAGNWAAVGTAGYPFGPYLTEGIPANPMNGMDTIAVVPPSGPTAGFPDDTTGWVFFAADGGFRANSSATCPNGDPVWDL